MVYNKVMLILVVWLLAGLVYFDYHGDREEIYASIEVEIIEYHHKRLAAGSKWPDRINRFDDSNSPMMDAWQKANFFSFDIPYRDEKIQIMLRGETMITSRLYAIDTSHKSLDDFAPLDFAIAWGPAMSDNFASEVVVYHTNRQANFRAPRTHNLRNIMSNIHLIPGSADIMKGLAAAKVDDRITLRGYAITAKRKHAYPWASDMTYGDENCEIIIVTEFRAQRPNGTERVRVSL